MEGYFFQSMITGFDEAGNPIYDRPYDGEDHANFYKGVLTNGVLMRYEPDAMLVKMSGSSATAIEVMPGRCFINGYQGVTDGTDSFSTAALADGKCRVIVRLDKSEEVRGFECLLRVGSANDYPELIREGNIYELCLANVTVSQGLPETITDTRDDLDLCGDVRLLPELPYYPSDWVPQILWLYTMFPDELSAEQRAGVKNNPELMAKFNARRLTTMDWRLLTSYTTAGTYQWTAPDLYGDGEAYEVGAFIIGGGGAGGAARTTNATTTSQYACATGGASGYTKTAILSVTPGNSYPVVVGIGGSPAVASGNYGYAKGNTGGTSTFNGYTASGGEGGNGRHGSSYTSGASGGQGSSISKDNITYDSSYTYRPTLAPAMGEVPAGYHEDREANAGLTTPTMSVNPFTQKRHLGAGGAANRGTYSSTPVYSSQNVPILDDGLTAGAGRCVSNSGSVTGYAATSPGSGGGGTVAYNASYATGATVTSGAGADGAVFIYVRRPVR